MVGRSTKLKSLLLGKTLVISYKVNSHQHHPDPILGTQQGVQDGNTLWMIYGHQSNMYTYSHTHSHLGVIQPIKLSACFLKGGMKLENVGGNHMDTERS